MGGVEAVKPSRGAALWDHRREDEDMGRPKHPGCVAVIDGVQCGDEVEAQERCNTHYRFWKRNGRDGGRLRCVVEMDGDRCKIRTTASDRTCSFHAQQLEEQGRITRLHPPEKVRCIGVDEGGIQCERLTQHEEGLCADCRPSACTFEGCGGPIASKGLCGGHSNQRFRGQVLRPLTVRPQDMDPFERFASYVKVDEDKPGCWIWSLTSGMDKSGYGRFSAGGRASMAYHWIWEQLVGPIPERHEADHVCQNTSCVSPAHLQVIPKGEHRTVTRTRKEILRLSAKAWEAFGVKSPEMKWTAGDRPMPEMSVIWFASENRLPFWMAGRWHYLDGENL